jgi:hypothetical protein
VVEESRQFNQPEPSARLECALANDGMRRRLRQGCSGNDHGGVTEVDHLQIKSEHFRRWNLICIGWPGQPPVRCSLQHPRTVGEQMVVVVELPVSANLNCATQDVGMRWRRVSSNIYARRCRLYGRLNHWSHSSGG